MKIKLSKQQWELIGKTTGWIKSAQETPPITYPHPCEQCHGKKYVTQKIKNLGTLEYRDAIVACPSCSGKGYVTQEDNNSYLHSMGVKPCSYGNDGKPCNSKIDKIKQIKMAQGRIDRDTGKYIKPINLKNNKDLQKILDELVNDLGNYFQWNEMYSSIYKFITNWRPKS